MSGVTDMRADVAAALAEPAFASLARAGAPVLVAEGEPARVLHASPSALALFAIEDCDALTEKFFAADDAGARRLSHLAQAILPGAAARLERIELRFGASRETVTFLCRRTPGAPPLFVLAALGLRAGQARLRAAPETPPRPPAPAIAAPASAAPVGPGTDALRADLARRHPGLAPVRFLWRTDADLVVTEITPPLAEIVGAGCADLMGRDLLEVSAALGLDPGQRLAAALRGRATFSGVALKWPIEGACAVAPVTLGGLPVAGSDRAFEGWRGFGVIHLDGVEAADPIMGLSATARLQLARVKSEPDPAPAAPAPEDSSVVVPLRPAARAAEVAPAEDMPAENLPREADSTLMTLEPHERNAFREIARRLGAPSGGDETADVRLAPPGAAPTPLPVVAATLAVSPPPSAPALVVPAAKAQELLDALPIGLLVARGDSVIFANRALLDWLGRADLADIERAGGLSAVCAGSLGAFAPEERRTLLLRPAAGDSFAVDARGARIDWDGGPAQLLTMVRPSAAALEQRAAALDATSRQSEAEAAQARAILDTACDGFVLVNADGDVLAMNAAAEQLFSRERDSAAGESFLHLLAPESHARALELLARAKGGEKCGDEVAGLGDAGAALPLHVTFGALDAPANGKYCLVLRDLGPWKRAETDMAQARAQAERDSQAKSDFLAQVSHEIRTPLNAILGFAEVIMGERFGPVGNPRYKEYLGDIHASGTHLMSLVNDLLDLQKIEAGKLELEFSPVDVNKIVAECVSLMQPQANREKVITRLALSTRLPPILADERSVRQIVLNLLANAVRYNEPGGQVIVSSALSESGHALLRVKDTGVGMSEKDLKKAMEPFRQVESHRGGTGLGLPLTKALAEANRAGFFIRSRKGEGTLVEVAFPLAPAEAAGKTA